VVAGVVNYYELSAQDPVAAAALVSGDRRTTIIPVTLAGSLDDAIEHGADVLALVHGQQDAAPGFTVLTVGDGSTNEEVNTLAEADIASGERIGATVAFVILILLFGALVAAFVPLILAILSIGIAFGLAAVVSQVSEQTLATSAIVPMIGLAVGVDYALFVVERYREERRRGATKQEAIEIAGGTASRAVLFSGITVVLALAGMFIAPTNDFRSLSIGAILVVVVAVVATLTLIPAVIALLGDSSTGRAAADTTRRRPPSRRPGPRDGPRRVRGEAQPGRDGQTRRQPGPRRRLPRPLRGALPQPERGLQLRVGAAGRARVEGGVRHPRRRVLRRAELAGRDRGRGAAGRPGDRGAPSPPSCNAWARRPPPTGVPCTAR
jgi:hypothetical protein